MAEENDKAPPEQAPAEPPAPAADGGLPVNGPPPVPAVPPPPTPTADKITPGPPPGVRSDKIRAANGAGAAAAATPAAKDASKAKDTSQEMKDGLREIVETVVFVVVLVLLLKAFLAEAFVIPTGSMATTLLGYHSEVECPQCGYRFPVNMSKEVDAEERDRAPVTGCICPNCTFRFTFRKQSQP